jgi:hypothetical protein
LTENSAGLTEPELAVLDQIGAAYRAFCELDAYHPSDQPEFAFHVHATGRIVLSRAAVRAHPERGWLKTTD